jgi:hypothetical protein
VNFLREEYPRFSIRFRNIFDRKFGVRSSICLFPPRGGVPAVRYITIKIVK